MESTRHPWVWRMVVLFSIVLTTFLVDRDVKLQMEKEGKTQQSIEELRRAVTQLSQERRERIQREVLHPASTTRTYFLGE